MSGGVFTAEAREFLDRYSERHLQKPFDLRQIHAMLQAHAFRAPVDLKRSARFAASLLKR
jgi:hypothetical protein